MTNTERRATLSLAGIFAFRMLGLFMILPVFTLFAEQLSNATPASIGIALGIYGLTQALLQIPFGMLSDHIGRKPVIAMGLVIFIIGSIVAALSTSIEGVIIGRAVQGAGAIGSTIIALIADLTREEQRTKAMAGVGMTIALSFSFALLVGPFIAGKFHLQGLFWLTAILGVCGIIMLYTTVPNPEQQTIHLDAEVIPAQFFKILTDKNLLRLDFGIFALHSILTAGFLIIPMTLHELGLTVNTQWYLYLPVLIIAYIAMLPLIILAEKKRFMRQVFIGCIATIGISLLLIHFFHRNLMETGLALAIFFTAFTVLEASLPSLISKQAPAGSKGTAMGIYSGSQFLGIFAGGSLGGWIFTNFHATGVLAFCSLLSLLWLIIAFTMRMPKYLATFAIKIGENDDENTQVILQKIMRVKGVSEAKLKGGVAYLKIDNAMVNKDDLQQFSINQ